MNKEVWIMCAVASFLLVLMTTIFYCSRHNVFHNFLIEHNFIEADKEQVIEIDTDKPVVVKDQYGNEYTLERN